MDPINTKFQTSFVPKKSVVTPQMKPISNKGNFIFNFVMFILFVAVALTGAGFYVYKISLENTIKKQNDEINSINQSMNKEIVEQATKLDNKISAVKEILSTHKSPNEVLSILELYTLPSIKFDTFAYEYLPKENINSITGSGIGKGYESIILQSDEFADSNRIKNFVFSDVTKNNLNNNVSFVLTGNIQDKYVLYKNKIEKKDADQDDLSDVNNNQN